jgi:hypothetical protein
MDNLYDVGVLGVMGVGPDRSCLTLSVPWSTYGTILQLVLKFLAQKGLIGTWIFWMKCISERLTEAKSFF